jgi:hypothetical protein
MNNAIENQRKHFNNTNQTQRFHVKIAIVMALVNIAIQTQRQHM